MLMMFILAGWSVDLCVLIKDVDFVDASEVEGLFVYDVDVVCFNVVCSEC